MRRSVILLLTVIFVICSVSSFASDKPTFSQGLSSGNSAGEYANQKLGSKSALKSRILTPASSGGTVQMHSLNGQNPFSGSISAPSGKKIMEILIHPSSTGDLSPVYIYQNTGSGNEYNYTYTIPFAVSGICANGVVRCDPGTWNNCKYYEWTANSSGDISLQQRSSTDFGGCYCINSSCGYDLASDNLPIVLKDIGGGAVGAVMKSGSYRMMVSGVDINSADIVYYGQMIKDSDAPQPSDYPSSDTAQYEWEAGSPNPSSYYSGTNGGYLFAAAGSTENNERSNSDSIYNLIATSGAAQENPVEQKTCYIKREANWNKQGKDDTQSGTLGRVGDNYLRTGTIYNKSFSFYVDNVDEIASAIITSVNYDDTIQVFVNGHVIYQDWTCGTVGASCCDRGANFRKSTDISFKQYIKQGNNTLSFTVCAVSNDDPNHGGEGWITYRIRYQAYYTPAFYIDNQCQSYENDSNCKLKDEWVDNVRTWSDYASTGLVPTGQSCKTFPDYTTQTYCYDWWTKKRVYICKINGFNFDKAKQRSQTIVNSTADTNVMSTSTLGGVNYQDYRSDNGSWGYHNGSMTVPLAGNKQGCQYVCKVKVPDQDTQAYSGTNTSQYRSIQSYSFDYRKCTNNNGSYTCPYNTSKGESVVTNCQCIDEFAEAATIMNTVENAGKDIICSSGVRH